MTVAAMSRKCPAPYPVRANTRNFPAKLNKEHEDVSLGEDEIAMIDSEHECSEDDLSDATALLKNKKASSLAVSPTGSVASAENASSAPLSIPIDLGADLSVFEMKYGAVDEAECPTSASNVDHECSVERIRSPQERAPDHSPKNSDV